MQYTNKKLPKSEIKIEGELETDLFETYFGKALRKIGQTLELDGFRKGKIPENVILSKVPEIRILEEMAELALSEHYPKIIELENLDPIGRPDIAITKLARKNPLGFKIKVVVMPEIKLPDYKKIAKKIVDDISPTEKETAVSDEELENTIVDIRKSRAPKKHITNPDLETSDVSNLPEFNDEFVKSLGSFTDIEDFKIKLRENIKLEKQNQAKEKTRLKIIEEIIEKSELEVPHILIEIELDKILYRMESDITQMGLQFEDYLKHLTKTKEDLRKDFRNDGEKKAKLTLILNEIAKVEKIIADEKQVAREVAQILEHYKEADPDRARAHAEEVLTNEKIFQFLESQT